MPWPNTWIFWNQTEQYMLTGELTCLYEIQNQHRTHKHKIKKMFYKYPCMSMQIHTSISKTFIILYMVIHVSHEAYCLKLKMGLPTCIICSKAESSVVRAGFPSIITLRPGTVTLYNHKDITDLYQSYSK